MNFFSKILEKKKLVFFVFLFFLISFISLAALPKTAIAQTSNCTPDLRQSQQRILNKYGINLTVPETCLNATQLEQTANVISNKTKQPASAILQALARGVDYYVTFNTPGMYNPNLEAYVMGEKNVSCAWDNLGWWDKVAAGMAVAFTTLLVFIPKAIASLAITISGWVIEKVGNWPITTGEGISAGFMAGWVTVRDFANMLIVLGFVIVGVATALRLREYEAKKALAPLIIVAFLVNFSGLICGLIVDASNFAMNGILNSGNTNAQAMPKSTTDIFMGSVMGAENEIICGLKKSGEIFKYMFVEMQFAIIYWLMGLCFLFLMLVLLARYAILGILFVFSPLAFVFWGFPFPKAKDLWNKWWSNFLKYAFVGVSIAFFLNIANKMLLTLIPSVSAGTKMNSWELFAYMAVVVAIIVIGIFASLKGSGVLSAAVMGAALAVGGAAMGAIGKVGALAGKGIDSATGGAISGLGRKWKGNMGRTMENLGLRAQGTTALSERGQMKDAETRVGAMTEQEAIAAANSNARSTDAKRVKLAAIQRLAKSGDIGKLDKPGDMTNQVAALQWAEDRAKGVGGDTSNLRKDAKSGNYMLAGKDPKKVQELIDNHVVTNAVDAEDKLVQAELDNQLTSMNHGQLRGINSKHLTADRIKKLTPEKISAFKTGSTEQIDELQTTVGDALEFEINSLEIKKQERGGRGRIDEGKLSRLKEQLNAIKNLK